MHDPRVIDTGRRQAFLQGIDEAEFPEIIEVMNALRDWRLAEERLSEASRSFMKLGDNDMRALRYVIVVTDAGDLATARGIARHLGISSAATTKLLDRLEAGGHIQRTPHPTDRRSLAMRGLRPRPRRCPS